ncbi:MAG: hypothetical protein AAGJ40_03450 [Planctomycetota bacterium]
MRYLLVVAALFVPMNFASAESVLWMETFPDAQGTASDRAITSGSGLLNVNGTATFTGNGSLELLGASGTRSSADFTTTSPVFEGVFQFDFALTFGAQDTAQDRAFIQIFEGSTRSTTGTPVDNFNDTLDLSDMPLVDGQTSTLRYFFNVTGSDLTYDAPDSSTRTLGSGAYDFWVDAGLETAGSSSSANTAQGAGFPDDGVNTLSIARVQAR